MSYSAWFGTLHNDMETDMHQFNLCPLDDLFPDVDHIWMENLQKSKCHFNFGEEELLRTIIAATDGSTAGSL